MKYYEVLTITFQAPNSHQFSTYLAVPPSRASYPEAIIRILQETATVLDLR